ncbi:MAG: AI-2E family transporter [Planctomycetaceae bacterium]|jgi:predicted PurR-regulated permease PerM|nr:AI-2E family transporter [Planctomycetaceae bacterium]
MAESNNKYRRLISFLVLIGIIVLSGAMFYQVMASFVLPLFLAAVLCVVFAPLHRYILRKYKARIRLAALTTTTVIGLVVLLPLITTVSIAVVEGSRLTSTVTPAAIADSLAELRQKFNLNIPHQPTLRRIEAEIQKLTASSSVSLFDQTAQLESDHESLNRLKVLLDGLDVDAEQHPSASERLLELNTSIDYILDHLDDEVSQNHGAEYLARLVDANNRYNEFKTALLGGTVHASIVELVNPSPKELGEYSASFFDSGLRKQLLSMGANTLAFALQLLAGIVIMLVATYFFLIDGARMVQSITKLSPLKQDYEDALIDEFVTISRAVVVATLLSALAQGILAGLGFWIAGMNYVWMLTVAATFFAFVPFIGAATVWLPCAVYMIVFADQPSWGVFLLIWGVGPVSLADNLVKPYILQNKSNLHPMLALLSVVGGVQALGPIGILTGPMVVVFLQTLLNLLHREISSMDGNEETETITAINKTDDDSPTADGNQSPAIEIGD